MKKIPTEIKPDVALFIDEMIEQIAIETQESIKSIISYVSRYYSFQESDLRDALKSINSKFTSNNNVIFYDGEKFVKRTAFLAQVMSIIKKIAKQLKRKNIEIDVDQLINILECTYK